MIKAAENGGLVTFTEEIPNGKLHFLCSEVVLLKLSDSVFSESPNCTVMEWCILLFAQQNVVKLLQILQISMIFL